MISSFVSSLRDSTHKQYYVLFVFLCLVLLSMKISRSIHVATNANASSFLWLSDIPLCIYLITHAFVDAHVGHFHFLAVAKSIATNIGIHASFQMSVFLFSRYMPRSGTAGS